MRLNPVASFATLYALQPLELIVSMLRTAILRSTAIMARTAVRPIPSAAARRIAVAPAPRVSSFVPKMVAWKPVRCYASGGSLERDEVYERVMQVLSNVVCLTL